MSLKNGTLLCGGMYRVEDVLGQGGFGITYRAVQVALSRMVCVKEFFLADDNVRDGDGRTVSVLPSTTTRDRNQLFAAYKAKFSHEAQRQASLDHNAHIVQVYNLWEENGTAYFAMEYIDGSSLDSLVPMGNQMPFTQLLDFTNQMLDVLEFIHNRGIYHLDIKPANIMMTRDGVVKLVDFGASKCVTINSGGGTTNLMPLTEGYAPIEQSEFEMDKIGPWTDLYALGATIYRLATGHRPPSRNAIFDSGASAFNWPDQSGAWQPMVTALMQYGRKQRPQTVTAARELLPQDSAAASEPEVTVIKDDEAAIAANPPQKVVPHDPSPRPQGPNVRVKPSSGSSKYVWWTITPLLILIAVCFFLFLHQTFEAVMSPPVDYQPQENAEVSPPVDYQPQEVNYTANGVPPVDYQPKEVSYTANGVTFTMVEVKGGTFTMGATSEQGSDAYDFEKPAHQVTLSDYYIGKTEVTEGLWRAVMGSNPSYDEKGDNYPVESVSWDDCQMFITKLNSLTGETFRLPTEAEWEFAARGGTMSRGYKYSGGNTIGGVAWYDGTSGNAKHPVATKAANELGIYDMSGNVWEWCQDWYDSYSSASQTNPTGPTTGSNRVNRGGSWGSFARFCRVSYRECYTPSSTNGSLGLRLAR